MSADDKQEESSSKQSDERKKDEEHRRDDPERNDSDKRDACECEEVEYKEWFPRVKSAWFEYYNSHRNQVVCALIGGGIAVGFLVIGFWSTLLLAVFITIGVFYGRYKDGDRGIRIAVARLMDRLD